MSHHLRGVHHLFNHYSDFGTTMLKNVYRFHKNQFQFKQFCNKLIFRFGGRGRNVSEPWLNYFSGQTSCKFVKTYYLISGSLLVKQLNSCIASASVNAHRVNAHRVSLPRLTPPPKPARMLQLQIPTIQSIRILQLHPIPSIDLNTSWQRQYNTTRTIG